MIKGAWKEYLDHLKGFLDSCSEDDDRVGYPYSFGEWYENEYWEWYKDKRNIVAEVRFCDYNKSSIAEIRHYIVPVDSRYANMDNVDFDGILSEIMDYAPEDFKGKYSAKILEFKDVYKQHRSELVEEDEEDE